MKTLIYLLAFSILTHALSASHLVGGNISYERIGGDNYKITVTLFRDCRPTNQGGGNPAALFSDNPLFLSIFNGNGDFLRFDSIISNNQKVLSSYIDIPCVKQLTDDCFSKVEFTAVRTLPPNSSGYYIVTQRCCWIGAFDNLDQSAANGMNTMAFIPPTTLGSNNSAVFKKDLNKVFCINKSQTLDCSATDSDGDSLSYELCQLNSGASLQNPKPILSGNPPPYPLIKYENGYNFSDPLGNSNDYFNLDGKTGIINFKPTRQGNYHIGICCKEWRNGNFIQMNERNIIIRVIACQENISLQTSEDITTPYGCSRNIRVTGSNSYQWSIYPSNQHIIYLNNDTIAEPSFSIKTFQKKLEILYSQSLEQILMVVQP